MEPVTIKLDGERVRVAASFGVDTGPLLNYRTDKTWEDLASTYDDEDQRAAAGWLSALLSNAVTYHALGNDVMTRAALNQVCALLRMQALRQDGAAAALSLVPDAEA